MPWNQVAHSPCPAMCPGACQGVQGSCYLSQQTNSNKNSKCTHCSDLKSEPPERRPVAPRQNTLQKVLTQNLFRVGLLTCQDRGVPIMMNSKEQKGNERRWQSGEKRGHAHPGCPGSVPEMCCGQYSHTPLTHLHTQTHMRRECGWHPTLPCLAHPALSTPSCHTPATPNPTAPPHPPKAHPSRHTRPSPALISVIWWSHSVAGSTGSPSHHMVTPTPPYPALSHPTLPQPYVSHMEVSFSCQ